MYDFTLLSLLTAAMIVIAKPYDWLAGLFAGVMFALVHSTEGRKIPPPQRDEAMTMLVLVGYALLFEALRRRKPWMMVVSGLSFGMASAMKPTAAPLAIMLLRISLVEREKKRDEAAAAICMERNWRSSNCGGDRFRVSVSLPFGSRLL